MTVGVGILGLAHGHVNLYCHQWQKNPELGISVRAVWDHDIDRMGMGSRNFGFDSCESPEKLLRRNDIDAVVIASETSLHADLVEKAARFGKSIVLQKPMALTLAEADRIIAAVDNNNVPFTMAWQMRVDPQNLKIKDLIESGDLGKIFMIRRRHGLPMCLNPEFADSWHVSEKLNRDIWADDAAHPVDFIYWLLGLPDTVSAEMMTLHDPRMPMDNGIAVYRYENGPLAEVCCSFTNRAAENTVEVIGENGSIVQNYGDVPSCNVPRSEQAVGLKWYLEETGRWHESEITTPDNHGKRIADLARPLAEFLNGERGPIASAEEGRDALKMILATYLSNNEGCRVQLTDRRLNEI